MSPRPPTVENKFYPGDKRSLVRMMEEFFTRAGGLPESMDSKPVKGVIVPHAGYAFSGPTAARSYKEIAKGFNNIDTFIILGPSHSGLGGKISISRMDFETAFGVVKNDLELTDLILERSNAISISEEAHMLEHSIEVQLPFLQYIAQTAGKDFQLVPIAMLSQNIHHSRNVGAAIFEAVRDSGKNVVVIASSDFTHGGGAYRFNPCPKNQLVDWLYEHDKLALDCISGLDLEGFLEVKNNYRLNICGSGPIGVLMEFSRLAGAKEARVLKYTTSSDLSHSLRAVVGYGSVVVE